MALGDAGALGRGVFAARRIERGDEVLRFGGPVLAVAEIDDFVYTLQVDETHFLGPSGELDDFVNHSCEPSCGLFVSGQGAVLRALRAIAPGEEITFDYATCMTIEPGIDACRCRARRCRGTIGRFWDLPPQTRARYEHLGCVPRFVQAATAAHLARTAPRARVRRRSAGSA